MGGGGGEGGWGNWQTLQKATIKPPSDLTQETHKGAGLVLERELEELEVAHWSKGIIRVNHCLTVLTGEQEGRGEGGGERRKC